MPAIAPVEGIEFGFVVDEAEVERLVEVLVILDLVASVEEAALPVAEPVALPVDEAVLELAKAIC